MLLGVSLIFSFYNNIFLRRWSSSHFDVVIKYLQSIAYSFYHYIHIDLTIRIMSFKILFFRFWNIRFRISRNINWHIFLWFLHSIRCVPTLNVFFLAAFCYTVWYIYINICCIYYFDKTLLNHYDSIQLKILLWHFGWVFLISFITG